MIKKLFKKVKDVSVIFLLFISSQYSYAENVSESELYKQVFGEVVGSKEKEVSLSAIFQEQILGEIRVTLVKGKVTKFHKGDTIELLAKVIKKEALDKINNGAEYIKENEFPYKHSFNFSSLQLVFDIPDEDLRPQEQSFLDEYIPYYANSALAPAPFSMQLNYKLEYLAGNNSQDTNLNELSGLIDHTMYINGFVLQNNLFYSKEWKRESTVLTFDNAKNLIRYQAGDVNNQVIGFMQSKSLGGLSINITLGIVTGKQIGRAHV